MFSFLRGFRNRNNKQNPDEEFVLLDLDKDFSQYGTTDKTPKQSDKPNECEILKTNIFQILPLELICHIISYLPGNHSINTDIDTNKMEVSPYADRIAFALTCQIALQCTILVDFQETQAYLKSQLSAKYKDELEIKVKNTMKDYSFFDKYKTNIHKQGDKPLTIELLEKKYNYYKDKVDLIMNDTFVPCIGLNMLGGSIGGYMMGYYFCGANITVTAIFCGVLGPCITPMLVVFPYIKAANCAQNHINGKLLALSLFSQKSIDDAQKKVISVSDPRQLEMRK